METKVYLAAFAGFWAGYIWRMWFPGQHQHEKSR